jgi:membrane protein CcdC involved in cytochrome C biogenesis
MAKRTINKEQFIKNYSQEVKELDTNSLKTRISKSRDYLKKPIGYNLLFICLLVLFSIIAIAVALSEGLRNTEGEAILVPVFTVYVIWRHVSYRKKLKLRTSIELKELESRSDK